MNILYLEKTDAENVIVRADRRYRHILRILEKPVGGLIEAGASDGTLGQARIEAITDSAITLSYRTEKIAPSLHPVRIVMGFPRPIQAGRILKDLTSLGVSQIWFALSDLGEKSYSESTFFKKQEFLSHLIEGAEQAGNPRLPEIRTFWSVDRALQEDELCPCPTDIPPTGNLAGQGIKIVLHPASETPSLSSIQPFAPPITLAIGSERGWTERELSLMVDRGFQPCSLGSRILKTETAAMAAVSVTLSRLGLL